MKRFVQFILASLIGSSTSLALEVQEKLTLEELQKRQSRSGQAYEKAGLTRPGQKVEIRTTEKNLMDQASFLEGAYGYALVPKGSVLTTGKSLKEVSQVPGTGKFMKWADFARAHRAHLKTVTVTAEHLEGRGSRESLNETKLSCEQDGRACVTIFRGQPVTIGKVIEKESPSE